MQINNTSYMLIDLKKKTTTQALMFKVLISIYIFESTNMTTLALIFDFKKVQSRG